jgi:hypothetical protein
VSLHQSSIAEHAVDAGGADGDDIGVKHHEGEPAVAFQLMTGVEYDDGFLLPVLEPPVARHQRVVFIGQAIPDAPVVKLARGDSQRGDEPPGWDLSMLGPIGDVIDNGVAYVVGNPGAGQRSPSSFNESRCRSSPESYCCIPPG